jgi:Asp-tRNA(Asn)/Glu-tRNA(Gln) amidotransferase A subunit family amidase
VNNSEARYSSDISSDLDAILKSVGSHGTNDTPRRSTLDYASAYRSKRTSPSRVMRRTLAQIKVWESQGLNIFSSVIEKDVLAQAKASDLRFLAGKPLSVLDGVPIAVKDMIDVTGHITYDGKKPDGKYKGWTVNTKDDILITRLRAAGAIILGMTIMTEGGCTPLGWNAHWRGPFNAYDRTKYRWGICIFIHVLWTYHMVTRSNTPSLMQSLSLSC